MLLDPTARITQAFINFSSSTATVDLTIQGTLDVVNPGQVGQTIFWDNLSTTHFSTANSVDGVMLQFQGPIAGLRLSSTTWTTGVATLKALQLIMG